MKKLCFLTMIFLIQHLHLLSMSYPGTLRLITSPSRTVRLLSKNVIAHVIAKVEPKLGWFIGARFLGALSPELQHIGKLGTVFEEEVGKITVPWSIIGGVGTTVLLMVKLKYYLQKRHDIEKQIQALEVLKKKAETLLKEEEEQQQKNIESITAEPQTERLEEKNKLATYKKYILSVSKQIIKLKENKDSLVRVMARIIPLLAGTTSFTIQGLTGYGLSVAGSLIKWIGERGIDPLWGGKHQ